MSENPLDRTGGVLADLSYLRSRYYLPPADKDIVDAAYETIRRLSPDPVFYRDLFLEAAVLLAEREWIVDDYIGTTKCHVCGTWRSKVNHAPLVHEEGCRLKALLDRAKELT